MRLRIECYDWKTKRWVYVGTLAASPAPRPYVSGGLGSAVYRVLPPALKR